MNLFSHIKNQQNHNPININSFSYKPYIPMFSHNWFYKLYSISLLYYY